MPDFKYPAKTCPHKGQVNLDEGPHCRDCGTRLSWVQAAQLESIEKELSEERKLKTRILDKFADYCIERNAMLIKS